MQAFLYLLKRWANLLFSLHGYAYWQQGVRTEVGVEVVYVYNQERKKLEAERASWTHFGSLLLMPGQFVSS